MQISQLETNSNLRPSVETSFYEHSLVQPTAAHSCPVSPVRFKNVAKLDPPPKRKPYRTVSFGPASFDKHNFGCDAISVESDQLSVEVEMSVSEHVRDVVKDEIFCNHLDLPGAIHSRLPKRKSATSTEQTSARNSYSKVVNMGRLKRTVSSGSAAITSITAQVI